jgi:CheY-like chemotaxis protein
MSETNKRNIVVIDDDQTDLDLISLTLEPRGFDVIAAAELKESVRKARQVKPVLIFVSIHLPHFLEIISSIQTFESLKRVPVVLIANPGELNPLYAATLGVVDVLEKPLTPPRLISKTFNALGEDADQVPIGELFQTFETKKESAEQPAEVKTAESFGTDAGILFPSDEPSGVSKTEEPGQTEKKLDDLLPEKKLDDLLDEKEEDYLVRDKAPFKKNLLIYSAIFILSGIGLSALFFTGTYEKILTSILQDESERNDSIATGMPDEEVQDSSVDEPQEPFAVETAEEMKILPPAADEETSGEGTPFSDEKAGTMITGKKRRILPKSAFLKKAPLLSGEESVPEENGTGTLPADTKEIMNAVPSEHDDTSGEEKITSEEETVEINAADKKRRVPPKSAFLLKKPYFVQVGAYATESNALVIYNTLKQKGYRVVVRKELINGNRFLHRVMVGEFASKEDAQAQSKELLEKEGIKSFLYRD